MSADVALNEIKRGDEAKRILENPLHKEAMQMLRDGLRKSRMASALGDVETHHRLVIAEQVVEQFEKIYEDFVATGKMANIQVQDKSVFKIFG